MSQLYQLNLQFKYFSFLIVPNKYFLYLTFKMQSSKIKLGYWAVRGKAQVPRLLLKFTGLEWNQVKYTDANQWFHGDKKHLGLQFPNLPYLIDQDVKLTQSSAIERYIIEKSEKHDLLGKNLKDKAYVNMLLGVLFEMRDNYGSLIFDKLNYKERKPKVWEFLKAKLQYLRDFIKDRPFALGYLTLVDFHIAEMSYYIATVYQDHYKDFQFLQKTRESLNALPQIKSYYEDHRAMKWPFNTPSMVSVIIKGDQEIQENK